MKQDLWQQLPSTTVAVMVCILALVAHFPNPYVCCTHLHFAHSIKPIHLVQQFQHSSLDLPLPTTVALIPLRTNGVNLICIYRRKHKTDAGGVRDSGLLKLERSVSIHSIDCYKLLQLANHVG
jgi:hypothetical protein